MNVKVVLDDTINIFKGAINFYVDAGGYLKVINAERTDTEYEKVTAMFKMWTWASFITDGDVVLLEKQVASRK